jgi:Piwi domain
MSVASNILRQMTYKLGGVPYTLPDLNKYVPKDTMIVGIDVHHSGEIGERRAQGSVVGFSATIDAAASEFYSNVVTQRPGQEIIESLSGLFTQAIAAYKNKNSNKAPANIIVLRDGVGEGQLQAVQDKELTQLNQVLA